MRQSAESIETASREITQGNQDLSSRTEMQAASVQETAASLDDLNKSLKVLSLTDAFAPHDATVSAGAK